MELIAHLIGDKLLLLAGAADAEAFWSRVRKLRTGCWEWTASCNGQGYGNFCRSVNGRQYVHRAHRAAYFFTHGTCPPLLMHHCDNRRCVRPHRDHVQPGTARENSQDMARKGRSHFQRYPEKIPRGQAHWTTRLPDHVPRGERHANAKLTDRQVVEIRGLLRRGRLQREVARSYQVSQATISKIAIGVR